MSPALSNCSPPEEVVVVQDAAVGLSGVIVMHSRALGPAAGGCRLWHYGSSHEVTADAMRLARGMTYKNALAGLPMGGGKAVLRMPEGRFDRRRYFEAFGRAVEKLRGRYVTAEDVGTSEDDMLSVARETRHVAGLPKDGGRPGGDPSPHTAKGVLMAMEVAARRKLGRPLSDCTVAIQGLGHVGSALAELLYAAGAKLVVCDPDTQAGQRVAAATGAELLPVEAIFGARADIFAPCALGGVLNAGTIRQLRAKVVCGAANNQLASDDDALRLHDRGILYAPDFAVNAGGIVNVTAEYLDWTPAQAEELVLATGDRLKAVFDFAEAHKVLPHYAAEMLARQRIAQQSGKLGQRSAA